jgi:hypothetical protein
VRAGTGCGPLLKYFGKRKAFVVLQPARQYLLHPTFRQSENIVEQKFQIRAAIIGDIRIELPKQLGPINDLSIVAIKMCRV